MVAGNKQRQVRVLGGLMIEELFYNQSSISMANDNTVRCHAMLDRKAQRRSRPNAIGRLRRFRMSASRQGIRICPTSANDTKQSFGVEGAFLHPCKALS